MANLVELPSTDVWAIEPAAGLGILVAALAEIVKNHDRESGM